MINISRPHTIKQLKKALYSHSEPTMVDGGRGVYLSVLVLELVLLVVVVVVVVVVLVVVVLVVVVVVVVLVVVVVGCSVIMKTV
jgi:hypothetical protein